MFASLTFQLVCSVTLYRKAADEKLFLFGNLLQPFVPKLSWRQLSKEELHILGQEGAAEHYETQNINPINQGEHLSGNGPVSGHCATSGIMLRNKRDLLPFRRPVDN